MEKNYTIGLIVVFLIILTVTLIMIFRKKDKEDTTPALTSSGNLLSTTPAGQQPLTGYNNMLVSDGTGNVSSIGFPLGTIIMWSPRDTITTPPPGWAICDGSTIALRDEDNNEFPYVLPDLRGRFPVGVGALNMTITNQSTGWNFSTPDAYSLDTSYTLKLKGGSEKVTLTPGQMPSHSHGGVGKRLGGDCDGYRVDDSGQNDAGLCVGDSNSNGNNEPHENRPPFCAVYFIIKIA